MCTVAWNWLPNTDCPLILIGNRDEYYARPTQPLHWWDDRILAGKDLQDGGTWLGVTVEGKLAILTNFRNSNLHSSALASRGHLVANFLQKKQDLDSYLTHLCSVSHNYNPFNLLLYDGKQLKGFESTNARIVEIERGIGGVSNANFNSPWPKLVQLKDNLKSRVSHDVLDELRLLDLLSNETYVHDSELPDTGIPIERERALSTCFVKTTDYGTRSSSVVAFRKQGVKFIEQSFDKDGETSLTSMSFTRISN